MGRRAQFLLLCSLVIRNFSYGYVILNKQIRPRADSSKLIRHKRIQYRIGVNIGWQQSSEYEDGIKYAHDEVTYRNRSGDTLHIPQAERYSTKDWWHNLKTIKTSRLLKRIRGVIIFNSLWALAVYIYHRFLPFTSPGSRAHSLLGSALGLLLVFRTNTAYNRFWEGRKIWEKLLNNCRNMARLTVSNVKILH